MSAQSPGLQYSLDGRSWTNPVTNSMFLAELASDQGLAGLLKLQLPPHSLQIFLHEVTHNWTFQSPVGGALALLRMRAERHAYACLAESKGGALGVLEDLSRYQLASELLRPLTEGFALFAEFDAMPGPSDATSLLALWVASLYEVKGGTIEDLRNLLWAVRLSDRAVERKANLLVQPFSSDAGGYLPGYLTIKNLWISGIARTSAFLDTDLFLTYARSFFYEDYGLVVALLDPDKKMPVSLNAIRDRITQRYKQFFNIELEQSVSEFTKRLSEASLHPTDIAEDVIGPELDEEMITLGKKRYLDMFEELNSPQERAIMGGTLATLHFYVFHHRQLMRLGQIDVDVNINARGAIRCKQKGHESPLLVLPPEEKLKAADGPGAIILYYVPYEKFTVVAITLNNCIIRLVMPKVDDEARKMFKYVINNNAVAERHRKTLDEITEKVVNWPACRAVNQNNRAMIRKMADNFHRNTAFLRVSDEHVEKCRSAMLENGLWDLFGNDAAFVHSYAALSNVTGSGVTRRMAQEYLGEGIDLGKLIDKIEAVDESYGLPLIEETPDKDGFTLYI